MEEERVVGLSAVHEPLHGSNHVGLGGNLAGVLRVVGQDNHVVGAVVVALHQELLHVVDIVDTAAESVALANVVDADQERLALTSTYRWRDKSGYAKAIEGDSNKRQVGHVGSERESSVSGYPPCCGAETHTASTERTAAGCRPGLAAEDRSAGNRSGDALGCVVSHSPPPEDI